jgi:branched-chain amino acid transport system substrate-binding protein
LFIKQAAVAKVNLPIVAGSGMSQPSTVALLEPSELKGVCAETNASPIAGGSPEMDKFLAQYRAEFKTEPDGFAVGQYDATAMILDAAAKGAKTPEDVRKALSSNTYKGLAMTYKSDGKGNMANSAIIICYDGTSRTPKIVKRYD